MESYYRTTHQLMSSLGLQIKTQNDWKLFKLLKWITVAIPFVAMTQEIVTFLSDVPTANKIFEFPCFLAVAESVIAVVTILRNREKLEKLMTNLNQLYEDMEPLEKKVYQKFVWKHRKSAMFFGTLAMNCIYMFNIIPIGRMMYSKYVDGISISLYPFFLWFPFDNLQYFISTYLYEVYCGHITVLLLVISLQLFILIVSQIVAQFNYLGKKIEIVINSFDGTKATMKERKKFYEDLKAIVETHCKLTDYSRQVSEIFGLICFALVTFGCIIICFTGFAAAMIVDFFVIITFSGFWSSICTHILLLCFYSDILNEASFSLADGIWNSKFYELDIRMQKNLLFVLMRSQRANLVVAGGFFKLDLVFSTSVFKTAYSFFALLQNVFND